MWYIVIIVIPSSDQGIGFLPEIEEENASYGYNNNRKEATVCNSRSCK